MSRIVQPEKMLPFVIFNRSSKLTFALPWTSHMSISLYDQLAKMHATLDFSSFLLL